MNSMDVPADRPVSVPATPAAVVKPTYITWLTLAFMTTASVASLRSAPTMAVYGLTCVFLYVVPAIVFLLPQALVAAELASGWSGGIFRWVSEGISARWGLLAVWCQFAMTIFYYPTLLGFVASTLAFVFNPDLADNGIYTGIVIVCVFWLGVFMSARGGTGGIAKLASKGLLMIARREGYLPPFFQHTNENEFPINILVVQGAITTVIALMYALIPS